MKTLNTALILIALATAATPSTFAQWQLMDNFQQWEVGQIFLEATDIGWHGSSPEGTDEYWLLEDPLDPTNISLYVESGNYGVGYGDVWIQKALVDGGIDPGETGTLFFRSYWDGPDNHWHVGTADRALQFDPDTGKQTVPGAWGDFNALIRLGVYQNIEHRDGGGYIATNPPVLLEFIQWYSFWLVVENSWNMSTTPPTSTGKYTLYMQGPGIGDGVSPTLIPVGSDPPKDKAFIRRAPVDEDGNPQAIIWAQFSTNSGAPGSQGATTLFLLDDFYFSPGMNLTDPLSYEDPALPDVPTNLKAVVVSNSQVQLTWKDNASNEAGYKILMKPNLSSDWIEVADITEEDANGYLVENIETIHSRFVVQAYTAEGGLRTSSVATATWDNPILQGAQLWNRGWFNLSWFGEYTEKNRDWISHKELGLSYLAGENADSFYIYSTDTGCWFWTGAELYPYLYKYGTYEGWYYFYRGTASTDPWFARLADETFVRASFINEAVPPPAAPTNLVAIIYGGYQLGLFWTDNADDETGYKIFMQVGDEGTWTELATIHARNQEQYIKNDIDASSPLRFRVQAFNAGSESELSNIALAEDSGTGYGPWMLIDDFQQFEHGQFYLDAADIGWYAASPEQTDEYWMLADPYNVHNVAMFVEPGNYGVGWGNVWIQKALPGGGIPPGETGTLFLRCLWDGIDNEWAVGTADKQLVYDDVTGLQVSPGAWGDFNALIRLGMEQNIEHRDGVGYVATNPPQVITVNQWYCFWLVVENTWDMSTTPPTSTGVYTLYTQGPGIGDGESPTLIRVGSNPPKDKAALRRAPVDEDGNPQAIIWVQFCTNAGAPGFPSSGGPFLLDDFNFAQGVKLSNPLETSP